ncbi:MAG: hydantoinase B/oxoprolinase family protein, partial [Alphaproteobacteria bacterium]|nr:hydantoinase B/oxoprolinase family protein [Alphaproteobacteria bacterium]
TGVWHGNLVGLFINGKNQKGHDTIGLMTETLAGSGGARTFADGVDFGGELPNPICRMANVEMTEAMFAVRYLFRRRMQDSAGAGQYRGGAGGEYAVMAHDSPDGGINYVIACKGLEVPVADGLGGGHTGAPNYCAWVHNNDALADVESKGDRSTNPNFDFRFAQSLEAMPGRKEAVHWGDYPLKGDDVLYVRWSGGGGFGDPLDREPLAVLGDFRAGITSLGVARKVFGVVFDEANESVDSIATIEQRQELRSSFMTANAAQ